MRTFGLLPLAIACVLTAGCHERRLERAEILALLQEATVRGRHLQDGYRFERHYRSDNTFVQSEGPPATGRWQLSGDQVCIVWDPPHRKSARALCRRIVTDDQGAYWKELDRRSGNTVRVVEYDSIIGPDGADRRRITSPGERWKRWLLSWRGVGLGLGALVFGYFFRKAFGTALRRRLFGVKAGALSYSYSELRRLPPEDMLPFLGACIAADTWRDFRWVVDQLFDKASTWRHAVGWFWRCVQQHDDERAARAIGEALDLFKVPTGGLEPEDGSMRFAYLLGKAHAERAAKYQNSNQTAFEDHKQQALRCYDHVRLEQPTAAPELAARGAPYRESPYPPADHASYAVLVGAAYEAMMYTSYSPPVRNDASSSSTGGG